jgi:hypothetical protein
LLNAVKFAFQNKYPICAILATTFEDLISQYLKTIDEKRTFEFQRYICSCDLIIIDNMQFAAGKSATQEEISYWFCEMLDSSKSVIIAWDRSDRCLDDLLTRMRDRYPETTLLFLIVDINGMKAVKDKYPFSKSIFLMPPSIEELKSRISSRGDNTPEEIENRIGMAVLEINESKNYDFVVVNNDVFTAAKEIVKIISTQEI